ncbi:MAG TPA: carbon-nitrogen hydrolase family protein [Armatimonadota bacterium]|nr:carbon-nitrogen hydrolase family protein [Armatimonadota bacterium]
MSMGTRARIATVSQDGKFKRDVEGNREYVLGLLNRALLEKPDLVCLPEAFHDVGVTKPVSETAESLSGPTIEVISREARRARCFVICPIHTREEGRIFNSAVLIGRDGEVAGVYHKACPVTGSADYTKLEEDITPGDSAPVFDLDFGRVGIQICFDVGFPENWQALADAGARIVFWPSAYDGGFPLRAYAYTHHYFVVSSTRTGTSRIIDPCGEILRETSETEPVIVRDINLDYVVSHWDWNMGIPDRIRAKYGDRVTVRQWDTGSAHFVVEPVDPALKCSDLQDEFGFESTAQYHERHRRAYQQIRAGERPTPQEARHGDRPQWGK